MDDASGTRFVVDASNVVGAVPDGWWRDRPAAARRLLERLVAFAALTGAVVELVLDAPDLPEGPLGGVAVIVARRRGRDAADERIVERVAELAGDRPDPGVVVVSSDRALRRAAEGRGATVVGAGAFLGRLDRLGC